MNERKLPQGLKVVANKEHVFGGVIVPTGPRGETKTCQMYVTLTERTILYGDVLILSPECVTLRALKAQIENLKADLDWVYCCMETMRRKQQGEGQRQNG